MSKSRKSGIASALANIQRQRAGKAKASEQYEVHDENSNIYEFVTHDEHLELRRNSRQQPFLDNAAQEYNDEGSDSEEEGSNYGGYSSDDSEDQRKKRRRKAVNTDLATKGPTVPRKKAKALTAYLREMASEVEVKSVPNVDEAFLQSFDKALQRSVSDTQQSSSLLRRSVSHGDKSSLNRREFSYKENRKIIGNPETPLTDFDYLEEDDSTEMIKPQKSIGENRCETMLSVNHARIKNEEMMDYEPLEPVCKGKTARAFEIEADFDLHDAGNAALRQRISSTKLKEEDIKLSRDSAYSTEASFKEFDVMQSSYYSGAEKLNERTEIRDFTQEDGLLAFYFIDAWEDASLGRVYLFGKLCRRLPHNDAVNSPSYASCCVIIEGAMRTMLFKPRKESSAGVRIEESSNRINESGSNFSDEEIAKEVATELQGLRQRYGNPKMMIKPVYRSYAFGGEDVRRGFNQLFMKVHISANSPPFREADLSGKTYSYVFGHSSSLVESFLLKKKVFGPSWLLIKHFKVVADIRKSWCVFELCVEDIKDIQNLTQLLNNKQDSSKYLFASRLEKVQVPFNIASINIQTIPNINMKQQEILVASLTAYKEADINMPLKESPGSKTVFVGIRKLQNVTWSEDFVRFAQNAKISVFMDERGLISAFFNKLQEADIDIIVGHNFCGRDLSVLSARVQALKIPNWHKLSRLKGLRNLKFKGSSTGSSGNFSNNRKLTVGRLMCDTYLSAKEFLKSRQDYELQSLCAEYLPDSAGGLRFSTPEELIAEASQNQLAVLKKFVEQSVQQSVIVLQLCWKLQVLPLTKELTTLAGNLWAKTLQSARADRNDFLLLHEFHNRKYVCPNPRHPWDQVIHEEVPPEENPDEFYRETEKAPKGESWKKAKGAPAFTGGLVLEPKAGLYDTFVLLLDFNSLYPSIIQEFNICFTTFSALEGFDEASSEAPVVSLNPGILPAVIGRLVSKRRAVKELMKHESDKAKQSVLEIRQLALKLTANSMYGCLGFSNSRFYAKSLAAYTTQQGRNALMAAKELVEQELHLNVLYGDTDSLMVDTGLADNNDNATYQNVLALGNKIKHLVNKSYKKLELDIDGVFRRLLLLKKKKYACVKVVDYSTRTFATEHKGLDIVRRDWCNITKQIGSSLLANAIFKDTKSGENSSDNLVESIHAIITEANEHLEKKLFPLESYVITKALTKSPELYNDVTKQPHVLVALRMVASGISVKAGNEISYIICSEKSIVEAAERGASDSSKLPVSSENTRKEAVGKSILGNSSSWKNWAERAFSLEEVKKHRIYPDIGWYKSQQLLPPIVRLCGQVNGTDATRLAACLGIADVSSVTQEHGDKVSGLDSNPIELVSLLESPKKKFANFPLKGSLLCQFCKKLVSPEHALEYMACSFCYAWLPIHLIRNWVYSFIFHMCGTYSTRITRCSDCGNISQRVVISGSFNCPQLACKGVKTLVPMSTPHEVYMYISHAKHLLSGSLKNFEADKNNDMTIKRESASLSDAEMMRNSSRETKNDSNIPSDSASTAASASKSLKSKPLLNSSNSMGSVTNSGGVSMRNMSNEKFSTIVPIFVDQDFVSKVCIGNVNVRGITSFEAVCERILELKSARARAGMELKFPHVLGLIRCVERLFEGIANVDYRVERAILHEFLKNVLEQSAYNRLSLGDIFEVFEHPEATKVPYYPLMGG